MRSLQFARRIDGKRYVFVDYKKTKAEATTAAKNVRSSGAKARVLINKSYPKRGNGRYEIWAHGRGYAF